MINRSVNHCQGCGVCESKNVVGGWEAGIRTPITWSRATCPTVERPPKLGPALEDAQRVGGKSELYKEEAARRNAPAA
jgi:hypothetical protein